MSADNLTSKQGSVIDGLENLLRRESDAQVRILPDGTVEPWNDPAGWVDHLIGDGKRDNIIVPMSVARELQALLRAAHEPAAQASKDHVIRTLRIAGASCDGQNAFDAAADMLLGQSDEPAGPASKQEAAGTVLLGSMDKRTYLYVCQTAERMEIERANARAAGVQDLHDFVFELDGQRFELPYRELCKRLRQEDKNVLLALVREGIKCGTSTRAFLAWVKRAEFIIANERAPDEPAAAHSAESLVSALIIAVKAERDEFNERDDTSYSSDAIMLAKARVAEARAAVLAAMRLTEPPSGAIESLREALRPFAEIGHWMHARPEVPDDEVVIEIRHINNARTAFTRGDFKRASLAYRASETKSEGST